jgi:hypothetical protein
MTPRSAIARLTVACLPWLLLVTCALAQAAIAGAPLADDARSQRQVLVMLRMPPTHYRPDDNYGADYGNAPGRVARRREANVLAREHGLSLHDEWPMPALGVDCFVLDAPDRDSALREARALADDPRVESAQAMQLFRTLGAAATTDPLFDAQPAAAAWHLRQLHSIATGKGVRVAIIDSGVAVGHPDLRGQVALSRNFVDARRDVGEAHGTAVAGIIGALEGNGIGIAGVAPQARLLALRACWQQDAAASACSSFTLARALQFAIDAKAQVINMSLSGPQDRLLSRLIDAALARGISIIGAIDARTGDGGFPASHPGVVAVEGMHARTGGRTSVRAPADGIPATLPDGGWGLVSGSSFATAQVSGLVALLRQHEPGITPARLRASLAAAPGLTLAQERPRAIDACAVLQRTAGQCACACAGPSAAR